MSAKWNDHAEEQDERGRGGAAHFIQMPHGADDAAGLFIDLEIAGVFLERRGFIARPHP